ncbi:hypothetical protein SAY87_010257 [Trapa incisa]|uniref:DM2 domain-containing protein n=1 Tax=Trapa incisa TaxID=236973 RepID=A0AAN7GDX1_9MYRT|nr:hypothetical protein SAY87_010257 [Trapa incisa]
MSSSTAAMVFRGCRALLSSARSASTASSVKAAVQGPSKVSKAAAAAATSAVEKPKARTKSPASSSPRKTPERPSGILKVTAVSPALAKFLNSPEASRTEAVKKIWSYIKLHDLQNPTNKREIFCDEKLKSIFDGKDKVGFLEIGKLLSPHFAKSA